MRDVNEGGKCDVCSVKFEEWVMMGHFVLVLV